MAGLFGRLIMAGTKRNKAQNTHYILHDYEQIRRNQDNLNAMAPIPHSIQKEKAFIKGVPVVWFTERGHKTRKLVFYIHGGGFNSGSAEYCALLPASVCKKKGWTVISPDYSLAPEHPFPEGLRDCFAAYSGLLDMGYRGQDIALMGDSAGGNLIFALTLMLRDEGLQLPACLCGISPVAVLDDSLPSRKDRVDRDAIIGADFTEEMAATYLNGHSTEEPYLSPGYGDFSGFPPIWMCVGTEEVFYDDAFLLKETAERSGAAVQLIVGKGMCHVYPNIPDLESQRAIRSMRRFLEENLG